MIILKGCIFLILLLVASNSDIRTRKVENYIPIMIVITALIGIKIEQIIPLIISLLLISLPLLIAAIIKPNSIGGADIKLMGASAFLLGVEKGFFALIIGLALSVIWTVITRKINKGDIKSSFPLVPYLSIGCCIACLL